MMFVQDKTGTFLEFHAPEVTKLLVPRDQIIGKNMKDILPLDVYKRIHKATDTVYKKKELALVAYDLIENGKTVYYEARIVPLNGTKVLTIVRDITKEITIKKELEESKEELKIYAQLLEEKVEQRTEELTATVEQLVTSNLNLEDQIKETAMAEKEALASKSLSTDIAKNFPNGFIIVFNPEFEIVLKEGEAIRELKLDTVISEGMTVDEITFFSKNQKKQLKEDILNTLSGEHLNFEVSYKNRPFAVNTKPLVDENTKISSAFFVYNDISEQKRIAQEIQNALKKEQELNELKSRFISMASHEFRTPLSAIQTSAILIGKQNEVGKEEKRMKYVNQIKNNVKNLVVILNDFLSLSKLEEGKVIANKEVFDFIDFSKTIIKELSITKKIGQDIIFSSPEDSLLINLDPKLVRHILINLLSNAIKYSPENSQINIKIKENKQVVSLEIQDQGIGIPEEEQEKLFERFFRAKNAQNIEGTGLGLNIVKQYVQLMDGTIECKSKPNEGSTFLVKWAKPNNK
jgi:signal transduction histidine kinase